MRSWVSRFILSGLGNWYNSWNLVEQAVPLADEFGFWGAVIPDHYMWAEAFGQPQKDSTLESWVALTYLAAKTQKIKLGTIVTPIPFRPPAMLAKMVATMDVLSSGRAILGVGAGWSQTEFEGYSTWDDPKTRVNKTKEGVELILQLWQKPQVDFNGKILSCEGRDSRSQTCTEAPPAPAVRRRRDTNAEAGRTLRGCLPCPALGPDPRGEGTIDRQTGITKVPSRGQGSFRSRVSGRPRPEVRPESCRSGR